MDRTSLLQQFLHIRHEATRVIDADRCTVAPAPELREKIKAEVEKVRSLEGTSLSFMVRAVEPTRPGLNDGLIVPPEEFPLGTPFSVIRSAAADRSPLRGTLRVIVVLVDFSDHPMTQTQQHFRELFFSQGVIPTKSVREYYADVTNGLIDIQGEVVGPFRLPQTLAQYAHGASGLGSALPNATTMARDAVIASDPSVNFTPYDNDGNGFVDAFIVIHAGSGGEVTGNSNDIWSHKWTIDGGARNVDSTKIFGYLTVPEDSKIGVCCHELGHLLFGFPDLYDTDGTSEGLGNWCLMAAGSWGGGGNTPVHPSAWCKANQGWAAVDTVTGSSNMNIPDVKSNHTVYRLWKDGGSGSEYFLMENRQAAGFDASLPGPGILIFHVDESIGGNTDEAHPKIALMQADGKKDLEGNHGRGDAGDPFPGSSGNHAFTPTSTPNSKAYSGTNTCVSVTGISAAGANMTASVSVSCGIVKAVIAEKSLRDTKVLRDKSLIHDKSQILEKPIRDKAIEKPLHDKINEGKLVDHKLSEGGGGGGLGHLQTGSVGSIDLEGRMARLESALGLSSFQQAHDGGAGSFRDPFIGSSLRPDLGQSALGNEEDLAQLQTQMRQGAAQSKRLFDSKLKEN